MTNETLVDQISENRTCANCACSITQEANGIKQLFCRLNPAIGKMVRTQVPRIIKGQPQIRDGKPVMEQGEMLGFMFAPTMASLVCFDGWRPMGTLPGDFSYRSSDMEKRFGAGLDRLLNDMKEDAAIVGLQRASDSLPERQGAFECSHGVTAGEGCPDCEGGIAIAERFN
jgi:hypothetical protein